MGGDLEIYSNDPIPESEKSQAELFEKDTEELSRQTTEFITKFFPAYADTRSAIDIPQENSLELLNEFHFYKICECRVYDVENRFEFFSSRMQKLFTTAYSINHEVCYGLVSANGTVSLVLGIGPSSSDEVIPTLLEGLLPGVKIEKYTNRFVNQQVQVDAETWRDKDRYVGCIAGTPALKIDGQLQRKELTSLMRSLNGQNYTIMVMCKPVPPDEIQNLIGNAIRIKDKSFAISKRSLSFQNGSANTETHSDNYSVSHGNQNSSSTGFHTGGLGGIFGIGRGKVRGTSDTYSQGYSDAIAVTINKNQSIAGEIQNGFAIELMNMADIAMQRLKTGRSIGMWKTVTSFSSDSEITSKIIQGSLYSEMVSGVPEVLPPVVFGYKDSCIGKNLPADKIHTQQLMIPKDFFSDRFAGSPLCSILTSEELCAICTLPEDNTIGFELHRDRPYALNYNFSDGDHPLGVVCEYDRPLPNMPFGLSDEDLNKHTLVCGITGCGKTNTVKKILTSIDKPFLVIEPAKKEYRNIPKDVTVYTLGRPEINCLRLNPFYVPLGISPQQHIDLLRDLFCASFAFYGPMPYILEKCLNRVYEKKGWNLILGFHPYLSNTDSLQDLFDSEKMHKHYSMKAHSYLFPSMQDLKDEIDHYINHEMTYEGEVKGNIQGAIKARIDSLCVGTKGYMFNTTAFPDFESLLSNDSVLELEGLSDDADKAFALGLLIIYINEYRQVHQELDNSSESKLKHLLVIEEAHRLLKNVSSENNEELGNPKGKAVEHFTNMLAEMRSYGQGVIIAEQIPSKLAPDVIKNSSNKIVHRIVAQDDQKALATTMGIYPEDAIYLGNSKVGYALCHKEGMVQPVVVKLGKVDARTVLDVRLYCEDLSDKMYRISKSVVQNNLSAEISVWAIKVLNSLMYMGNSDKIFGGIHEGCEEIASKLTKNGIALSPGVSKKKCILECISDSVVSLLVSGVYSNHKMPSDTLVDLIANTIIEGSIEGSTEVRLSNLHSELEIFYCKRPSKRSVEIVSALVSKSYVCGKRIDDVTEEFLVTKSRNFSEDVKSYLKGR